MRVGQSYWIRKLMMTWKPGTIQSARQSYFRLNSQKALQIR